MPTIPSPSILLPAPTAIFGLLSPPPAALSARSPHRDQSRTMPLVLPAPLRLPTSRLAQTTTCGSPYLLPETASAESPLPALSLLMRFRPPTAAPKTSLRGLMGICGSPRIPPTRLGASPLRAASQNGAFRPQAAVRFGSCRAPMETSGSRRIPPTRLAASL